MLSERLNGGYMIEKIKQYWLEILMVAGLPVLVLIIIVTMFTQAREVRNRYAVPGEPRNSYKIHLIEKGFHTEQVLCASPEKCVGLITPGLHSYLVEEILVDGVRYESSLKSLQAQKAYAKGIYCPGVVDVMSCFEVIVVSRDDPCPKEIEFLKFSAPLYPDSCLVSSE